jgi:hypothetical protein
MQIDFDDSINVCVTMVIVFFSFKLNFLQVNTCIVEMPPTINDQ